ncbi:CRISPR-associated helicase/endonuclease Cas3 [Thioalkalivibrio thiocyanodenitrificans]|uniref:CRISPR-associated helicase/endonuclease Cas3 n=1 Tax=Thioalkalivibrio thiocyanodenitrificans TaxID=243063 RepID=UPI00035CE636|nr:CRISPR-associated helicase/endonuclease Cas3 [Thioalkalivibrio thiocyanodenitrificans]
MNQDPSSREAQVTPRYTLPWGKWVDENEWLPLSNHSIDVAQVFMALVRQPWRRARLLTQGKTLDDRQLVRLAVLVFLHDIGKCNWGFQVKNNPYRRGTAGHVTETVALLRSEALQQRYPAEWRDLLQEVCGWFTQGEEAAVAMLLAALSHHGKPARWSEPGLRDLERYWEVRDGYDPMSALADMARVARKLFPDAFVADTPCIDATPELQHRFAGLLMLADWVGSDRQFFPCKPESDESRFAFAQRAAEHALSQIGLAPGECRNIASFLEIFGFEPTPLQRQLFHELPVNESTQLVLAESDTGSGKTEAALAWFLRLYAEGKVDGLYFALPTRVAARELYSRTLRAIEAAFKPESRPGPVLLAAPGYVRVDGAPVLADPEGVLWDDENLSRQRERLWASERPKRFLAAPVAVGTIDQALLSVLKVKHSLLRSVCLDRHLLVVDEVHASDAYMREVLTTLIRGHVARGGWVLLLSATLGESAASAFFERTLRPLAQSTQRPYPSLTTRAQEQAVLVNRSGRVIDVELSPTLENDDALLDDITSALREGARILVICNTVKRATAMLRAVEAHLSRHAPELLDAVFAIDGVRCPHHGRYTRADRERMDAEVTRRLGKGSPDGPVLLIGTQTLEQSLDIDADWLITDITSMDVLLQRLGRLHRHLRENRPASFRTPKVLIRVPSKALHEYLHPGGQLRGPAGLGSVYADGRVLECTLASLRNNPRLVIPEQNRQRIEQTTHPEAWAALPQVWETHAQYIQGAYLAEIRQAMRNSLEPQPFGELHYSADEERVTSRLGDPSCELALVTPTRSPIGSMIERVNIPAYYLYSLATPEQVEAQPFEGGFRITVEGHAFTYTRFGLEKEDARLTD